MAGALEDDVDGIWIQGVGGPYGANTGDNLLPKGSSQRAIDEAIRLYDLANSKCPEAAILTAGYRFVSHLFLSLLLMSPSN